MKISTTLWLVAALSAPAVAHADLVWTGPKAFDYGTKPAVAVGQGALQSSSPTWKIEVHQGDYGSLWVSDALGDPLTSPFGGATQYDSGGAPALATLNEGDLRNPQVVEVHEGAPGDLWFRIGSLGAFGSAAPVSWSGSTLYDHGYTPAVAAFANAVVEVHQASYATGALYARVGTPNTASFFAPTSVAYDNGVAPAIALTTDGNDIIAVEVHQAQLGVGPLWYRTGVVRGDHVDWNDSHRYDNGVAPSVAIAGTTVIEVHQALDGVGPLWMRTGQLQGGTIAWDASSQYDYGYAPSVAYSPSAARGVEVHQAEVGDGPLWTRSFRIEATLYCAYCNDGSEQTGYQSPEALCASHGGVDPTVGCTVNVN